MRTANAFSGPRRCSVAQFDSWDFNLKLATNSFPLSKFKPNLGAELPHFFKCEMVGRFTEQNSQESQLSLEGDSPKKGKRIWEFFSPVFLEHLVFQKKVLLAAVKCDLTSESRVLLEESNSSKALKVLLSKELLWNELFLCFASNKVTDQEKSCSRDKKSHDRGCPSDRATDGPAEES